MREQKGHEMEEIDTEIYLKRKKEKTDRHDNKNIFGRDLGFSS